MKKNKIEEKNNYFLEKLKHTILVLGIVLPAGFILAFCLIHGNIQNHL